MRITGRGLRRLIREEIRRLSEGGVDPGAVRAFFSGPGRSNEEFSTWDELLVMLASGAGHSRVALVAPDPDSYGEPDLLEVGVISFEASGAAPPGWESMWWWPLEEGVRPDLAMRSPRYRSMLDAAAVSLRHRGGESLGVFGSGPGLPRVWVRVTGLWEDTSHLSRGFAREWWEDLTAARPPGEAPVAWLGSDDPMTR